MSPATNEIATTAWFAPKRRKESSEYLYDSPRLLAETDSRAVASIYPNPAVSGSWLRRNKTTPKPSTTYHLDHLGTPREQTDTDGRIVWSAHYRAYGNLALADVEAINSPNQEGGFKWLKNKW